MSLMTWVRRDARYPTDQKSVPEDRRATPAERAELCAILLSNVRDVADMRRAHEETWRSHDG